jgi:hypothetical protein
MMDLMIDAVSVLYAVVGAARTFTPSQNEELRALWDVLVASAAIGATEGEAFILLASSGRTKPAYIHARALGQIATRCRLLPGRKDIALQMVNALEPSRKELAARVPDGHPVRTTMEKVYAEIDGETMEKIERGAYSKEDKAQSFAQDSYETKMNSKWNHADITALADAGDSILQAGPQIQAALYHDPQFHRVFARAIGHVLSIVLPFSIMIPELGERIADLAARWKPLTDKLASESAPDRSLLARIDASLSN